MARKTRWTSATLKYYFPRHGVIRFWLSKHENVTPDDKKKKNERKEGKINHLWFFFYSLVFKSYMYTYILLFFRIGRQS